MVLLFNLDGYTSGKEASDVMVVAGKVAESASGKEAEVVHAAGKAARKRTISMTKDLLELDDLSLADDISTRRRLFDIRCVKRKFSNRKVVFTPNGFILEEYLSMGMEKT